LFGPGSSVGIATGYGLVAVCFEIRKKHLTKSEHHVEFLNVKRGGT
jgi:hypothetical protein